MRKLRERCLGKHLSVDIERVVSPCIAGPFDQCELFSHNLQAGDAAGMNAAASVEIRGIGAEPGAVCVAADQDAPLSLRVIGQALFHLIFVRVVLGGAGGVKHAEMFQGLPEISHQKAGKLPEGGIQRIGLMPVSQIKAGPGIAGLQDKSLIKGQSGEQGLMALGVRTKISIADLVGITRSFFLHIVIAIQQIEPPLPVKQGEEPEYIVVDLYDLAHAPVFPQFVTVAQLDIGEALGIIVLQGSKIQVLIFQEIVSPGAVTPVTVADQDIAATVAQRQDGSFLEGVV